MIAGAPPLSQRGCTEHGLLTGRKGLVTRQSCVHIDATKRALVRKCNFLVLLRGILGLYCGPPRVEDFITVCLHYTPAFEAFSARICGVGICSTWGLRDPRREEGWWFQNSPPFLRVRGSPEFWEVRMEKRNCRPTAAPELPGS